MAEIRTIERVSEEYIRDPQTDLYYWLAPVYKRGSDQQLLDDMNAMVKRLGEIKQTGSHVFRPTAMIQANAMSKISLSTRDTLGKNTYLMLFDVGVASPNGFSGCDEWLNDGNYIFLWSSDTKVYTWCTPDNLAHRFPKATKAEAMKDAFTKPEVGTEDPEYPEPYPDVIVAEPVKKWHVTGTKKRWTLFGMKTDIYHLTVEAE
jgi:hypothetical protein